MINPNLVFQYVMTFGQIMSNRSLTEYEMLAYEALCDLSTAFARMAERQINESKNDNPTPDPDSEENEPSA